MLSGRCRARPPVSANTAPKAWGTPRSPRTPPPVYAVERFSPAGGCNTRLIWSNTGAAGDPPQFFYEERGHAPTPDEDKACSRQREEAMRPGASSRLGNRDERQEALSGAQGPL